MALLRRITYFAHRYWRWYIAYNMFALMVVTLTLTLQHYETPVAAELDRRFNWNYAPTSEKCYKQERTATLLALWLGTLGVDQWYARHWVLAVFKMLTFGGLGLWACIDVNLWIAGGVYGTHGCKTGVYG